MCGDGAAQLLSSQREGWARERENLGGRFNCNKNSKPVILDARARESGRRWRRGGGEEGEPGSG